MWEVIKSNINIKAHLKYLSIRKLRLPDMESNKLEIFLKSTATGRVKHSGDQTLA